MIRCPQCGCENSLSAQFCVQCHHVLIHRCPRCWHEQREGMVCEKCGTNFALFWELAFERSIEAENRLWWDRLRSGIGIYLRLLLLPFTSLYGLLRALIARLLLAELSRR